MMPYFFLLALLGVSSATVPFLSLALLGLSSALLSPNPALTLNRTKPTPLKLNTTSSIKRGVINVHIQPHSHLDAGWIKTVDEYLMGQNNTIQQAGVYWIFQSVLSSLEKDPNRKFTLVETGFITKWLDLQPPNVVATMKALVASGQLTAINGGYVMHDEACPIWSDNIDQTTLGHRLLSSIFGEDSAPRVNWQIDPFGHSSAQASHFTALMGMGSLFYGRIDTQERDWRIATNATEYVWRSSRSLGSQAQILAGFNVQGYDPPREAGSSNPIFEWDIKQEWDCVPQQRPALKFGPLQPFKNLDLYNAPSYINATLELALKQASYILPDGTDGTVHIAWQFGTDFNYQAAETWFQSIDWLISLVNSDPVASSQINLLYSTPQDYADAKLGQDTVWPLKSPTASAPGAPSTAAVSTDQFPLADNPHWQWTGYFTSRPALKGYVRTTSTLYTALRQAQAWSGGVAGDGLDPSNPLYSLERALGIAQHHDGVSGTARQHVTYDYAHLLSVGVEEALPLAGAALERLTGGYASTYSLCQLSNATICASLEAPNGAATPPTLLIVWNSATTSGGAGGGGVPIRVPVALPPGSVASWRVTGPDGVTPITAQLLPISTPDAQLRTDYYGAPPATLSWLAFIAPGPLPPAGFTTFFLTPVATPGEAPHTFPSTITTVGGTAGSGGASAADIQLTNGPLTLTLDGTTHLVSHWRDTTPRSGGFIDVGLTQEVFYYVSHPGCTFTTPCPYPDDGTGRNAFGQSSSPYILRVNSTQHFPVGGVDAPFPTLEILTGPVVSEARQVWGGEGSSSTANSNSNSNTSSWVSTVVRLWNASAAHPVHFEWTVGPIPLGDGWGKEVLVRWGVTNSGASGGGGGGGNSPPPWGPSPTPTFFTDSNGLEMQKRTLNTRSFPSNYSAYEPIAANFYPVTTRAHIVDPTTLQRFTLATDRAQGCASLVPGAIECMLHRRHTTFTFLGNGEPLNEPGLDARGVGLVVRGLHVLRLDPEEGGVAGEGGVGAAMSTGVLPPTLFFAPLGGSGGGGVTTPSAWVAKYQATFSGLVAHLPPQLHLLTSQSIGPTTLLVRLQHLYEEGEDPVLSANATVNLSSLFTQFNVTAVTETTLSASLPLEKVKKWTLRVEGEGDPVTLPYIPPAPQPPLFSVTLSPQQIRTFVATIA